MAGKRTGPAHHSPLHSSARLFGTSLVLSLTGAMPSFDRVRNLPNFTAENTAHRPRQDAIETAQPRVTGINRAIRSSSLGLLHGNESILTSRCPFQALLFTHTLPGRFIPTS
ncbi:hypothetical protein CGRA01v4_00658 [Colletotrichum graminicola]|nr:hypothetical protein CGRA01v4_00658 [Colletotrichum graminicola]